MRRQSTFALSACAGFAADWLTDGGDTKRTNWQRSETIITPDNVKDLKLIWKVKLDNVCVPATNVRLPAVRLPLSSAMAALLSEEVRVTFCAAALQPR